MMLSAGYSSSTPPGESTEGSPVVLGTNESLGFPTRLERTPDVAQRPPERLQLQSPAMLPRVISYTDDGGGGGGIPGVPSPTSTLGGGRRRRGSCPDDADRGLLRVDAIASESQAALTTSPGALWDRRKSLRKGSRARLEPTSRPASRRGSLAFPPGLPRDGTVYTFGNFGEGQSTALSHDRESGSRTARTPLMDTPQNTAADFRHMIKRSMKKKEEGRFSRAKVINVLLGLRVLLALIGLVLATLLYLTVYHLDRGNWVIWPQIVVHVLSLVAIVCVPIEYSLDVRPVSVTLTSRRAWWRSKVPALLEILALVPQPIVGHYHEVLSIVGHYHEVLSIVGHYHEVLCSGAEAAPPCLSLPSGQYCVPVRRYVLSLRGRWKLEA
eukprot:NODE_978_length_1641_cov_13.346734_g807_i0.p1 GENE.NODE_978_length_1641_cov_13.346734_g807_i0~~NODE_978_length_1641_cov_13.346734_g807_i0.p1  ORF type:complete len:383 (-),score=54.75 NODE_978_length_1641_cov_13.346734_g807_i0:334-1482(-)